MRPVLVTLVAVSLVMVWTSGCGRQERRPEKIEITFWHSFVASSIPAVQSLLEAFEAEHPGIEVKAQYVPTGDALIQKLVTAVQSNTAPDISWVHADFIDQLVQARAIYPMDEFIKGPDSLSERDLADIFTPLLQAARWHDTLYALPMEATSLALIYNKDLFRRAGLDPGHPPRIWEELKRYTRLLTVDADADGKFDRYGFYVPIFPASGDLNIWMTLQWTPFLWQAGGQEIDSAQTHMLFNSQAGVKALTLWKNLYDDMRFSSFSMAHDMAFVSQRLAMVMDGPWNLPRYRLIKDFAWGVAPLPAGPAGSATYVAGEHLVIFRQSKHPSAAWTFVKWMVSPEVQAVFSMKSGYLPVRRTTLELPSYRKFLESDHALQAFVEQLAVGRARSPIDRHRIEINRYLAAAIEKATLGGMDPQQMLNEAAEKSDALLKPAAQE